MGRWSYSDRKEADWLKKVEISWLKKQGYLNGWKSGTIKWTHGWSGTESSVGIEVSTIGDLRKYYMGEPTGESCIRFHYTQTDNNTGEKKNFDYKIPLTTTDCYYGGKRYWFICQLLVNGRYCGRRVGVLYKASDYFGCRTCQNLTYESRNLSGLQKIAGKTPSFPEVERLEKEAKRAFYKGKFTRKYRRFLKQEEKLERGLQIMAYGLSARK